jgi:type IV pilus assembly protein PilB
MGMPEEDAHETIVYHGKGCPNCSGTGYRGRIAFYEVMPLREGLKELILEGASASELKRAAQMGGMKTLRESGLLKIRSGVTSIEEVLRVTASDTDKPTLRPEPFQVVEGYEEAV